MRKKLFLSVLGVLLVIVLKAQQEEYKLDKPFFEIQFIGNITNDSLKTKQCEVKIYNGNNPVKSSKVSGKGKFKVTLATGREYTMEITSPDHLNHRISINTAIVDGVLNIPSFEFSVKLVNKAVGERKNIDSDLIEFPVALIVYDEAEQSFLFDEIYTDQFIEERERSGVK